MNTTGFDFDVITSPPRPRNESAVTETADAQADTRSADHTADVEGERQR